MFPPGLGPDRHIRLALKAQSPLSLQHVLDEDIAFGVEAAAVWGPYIGRWRESQQAALLELTTALQPLNRQLVQLMHPYVHQVAKDRFPAGIAATVVLLRWPDGRLPKSRNLGSSDDSRTRLSP